MYIDINKKSLKKGKGEIQVVELLSGLPKVKSIPGEHLEKGREEHWIESANTLNTFEGAFY